MTKRKIPNHALFCLLRNSAALVKAAGVEPYPKGFIKGKFYHTVYILCQ